MNHESDSDSTATIQKRKRLSLEEAYAEAYAIARSGFRDILLVSGEDRSYISVEYLCELTRRLRKTTAMDLFSSVSVEIFRLAQEEYACLLEAGIDGVTLFQETYNMERYAKWHVSGPKIDARARINASESAAKSGMRRIGLGVLLGLEDWRLDALAMAAHADYIQRAYWRAQISFSLPRIRPAETVGLDFPHAVTDEDFVQLMTALRLCFPDAGITLSTREGAWLRDKIIPLGVTQISAGSHTEPGGYITSSEEKVATPQFEIADTRSPNEMAAWLSAHDLDPTWKDWDAGFIT